MPVIHIKIENKRAHSPTEKIVCGNSDYVIAFDFDEEWGKYVEKTAFFVCGNGVTLPPVIFQGNECPVPVISNTTMVGVGVSAGDLHTTTKALIACEKSIRCGLDEPQEPKPDVYDRIMELLNEIILNGGGGGSGGADGVSPTVDVKAIENGYRVTITDVNGQKSFDLLNGKDGKDYVLTETDKNEIVNAIEQGLLGDIDTALDGIIAIQDALIGRY